MVQEFDMMIYIPGITYRDIEDMPKYEREFLYEKLKSYLKEAYGKK